MGHAPDRPLESVTEKELLERCATGDEAACAELDHRGVELSLVTAPEEPLPTFDIAREREPNTKWLRDLAATCKHEAALLSGFQGDLLRKAVTTDPETGEVAARRMAQCVMATMSLEDTAARLLRLCDALDTPEELAALGFERVPSEPDTGALGRLWERERAAAADDPRGESDR